MVFQNQAMRISKELIKDLNNYLMQHQLNCLAGMNQLSVEQSN